MVRFLLDENVDPDVRDALRRVRPEIPISCVGDPGRPPKGTPDPDLLIFCESAGELRVTNNRTSMPGHVGDHFAAGRQHWGILQIRPKTVLTDFVQDLILIWDTTDADDWQSYYGWIPL